MLFTFSEYLEALYNMSETITLRPIENNAMYMNILSDVHM